MNSRLSARDLSLNNSASSSGDDSGSELIEFLPETRPSQELRLISREDFANKNNLLTQAMKILNNRELHILTERKLKDSPKTLDALSNEYKISKERIRQIENTAFEKVKKFILQQVAISPKIA
jgi:RNA polymerase sigma-32 factor